MIIVLLFAVLMMLQTTEAGTQVVRRGFKSSLLSTARGFGKRASLMDRGIIPTTAIGFGKRTLPLRGHDLNSQELSSLRASPDASHYGYEMDSLMHQLNVEAFKNPRLIPLLLEVIRSGTRSEEEDSDVHGYDESQLTDSN